MVTFLIDRLTRAAQRAGSPGGARLLGGIAYAAWNRHGAEVDESESEYGAGLLYHLQEKRFRSSIRWVASRSPYYRELFAAEKVEPRAIRSVADLRYLPLTPREDVVEWRRFLAVPESEVHRVVTSAGTFGEPHVVPFTAADWNQTCSARAIAIAAATGAAVGRRRAGRRKVLIIKPAAGQMWADVAVAEDAFRRLGMDVLVASDEPAEEAVRWMVDLQPDIVAGSPLALSGAVGCAADVRFSYTPEAVFSLGEATPPDIRVQIRDAWGTEPIDSYGLSEMGGAQSLRFPGCRGHHLNALDFLIEVVDPETGEPAHMGELVVTTLLRRATPLVRYRTGDIVRLAPHDCRVPFPSVEVLESAGDLVIGGLRLRPVELAARAREGAGRPIRVELSVETSEGGDVLVCSLDDAEPDTVQRVERALLDAYPSLKTNGRVALEMRADARLDGLVKSFRVVDSRSRV